MEAALLESVAIKVIEKLVVLLGPHSKEYSHSSTVLPLTEPVLNLLNCPV